MRCLRILRLVAVLAPLVALPAFAQSPAGRWAGTVELASGPVEVLIHLERAGDGWSGTLAAPALDLDGDLPLSEIEVEGPRIAFTAAGLGNGVRLLGELAENGSRLAGESAEEPPSAPPATDIHLFALDDRDAWSLSSPLDITDRDGYDNQPHFLPDGSAVLYTSIRDGQADVYRYDLKTGATERMTNTPESEYSPTPQPNGRGFSTVRVEADGTQRLWSFPFGGGEPTLLLEEVQPVGYHVWLSDHAVGLFVLGDPPTLEVVFLGDQRPRRIAENIGRSLHLVPGSRHLSFVRKLGDSWYIDAFDPWIDKARKLIETRPGSEDFAWTEDGRILMGQGSKLYGYRPGPRAEVDPWVEIADLESVGVRGITRLAVAPGGRHLAVVGERAVAPPPAPLPRPFELERR